MQMDREWTAEEQREHRKLWVEALRSGKYQQASGALKSASGMCCLGVACDLSAIGRWDEGYYYTPGDRSKMRLPGPVRKWLGLTDNLGKFEHGDLCLAELNDHGKTFAEIADIIEAEPEGLIEAVSS